MPNPDAYLRDRINEINTPQKADNVLSIMQTWQSKVAEIEAEHAAIAAQELECKNFKEAIADFDPETISSGNAVNVLKNVTKALKCITKGR
jgi:prefoldin subunit 5